MPNRPDGPAGGTLPATAARPQPAHPGPGARVRFSYLLTGLVTGGVWAWSDGSPLWMHAARIMIIVLTAPFAISRLQRWRDRRRGANDEARLSVPRLIAAKMSLLAAALAVNWLLGGYVADAGLMVSAGLAVTVMLLGPQAHPYFLQGAGSGQVRGREAESRPARLKLPLDAAESRTPESNPSATVLLPSRSTLGRRSPKTDDLRTTTAVTAAAIICAKSAGIRNSAGPTPRSRSATAAGPRWCAHYRLCVP